MIDRKSGMLSNTLEATHVLRTPLQLRGAPNTSFLQPVLLLRAFRPHTRALPSEDTLGWGRRSTRLGYSCSRWAQPFAPAPAWKMQIRQTSSVPTLEGTKHWIPAPGYCLISNKNICSDHWQSWREILSNQALQNLGLTISQWNGHYCSAKHGMSDPPAAVRDRGSGYFSKYKTQTRS